LAFVKALRSVMRSHLLPKIADLAFRGRTNACRVAPCRVIDNEQVLPNQEKVRKLLIRCESWTTIQQLRIAIFLWPRTRGLMFGHERAYD
jgi:hypothetical protein